MSTPESDVSAARSASDAKPVINPGALPDDFYAKKDVYYQATREELLPFFPKDGKTVLDVGCGEGLFGKGLKQNFGAEVWGVDISEASISAAEKNLDKAILADITTNLDVLPDNYFDIMYFNDVLEHMIDPYTLLANISSKLSENGRVVASIPNIMHHKVLWNLIFKHDFRYENAGVMDETHLRWFTRKSMMRMFSEAGFIDVETMPVFKTKSYRPLVMQIATLGMIGTDISYPQFIVSATKAPS